MTLLLETLFAVAITLSGYAPAPRPALVLTTATQFDILKCGGAEEGCGDTLQGAYSPASGEDVILIRENLDVVNDIKAQAIVVHEYVHYLQQMNGGQVVKAIENPPCGLLPLEIEAYKIQDMFLDQHGETRAPSLDMVMWVAYCHHVLK